MHCQYDQRNEGTERTDRVLWILQLHQFEKLEKGIDRMNLKQFFHLGFNGRVENEFKIDNIHINVASNFSSLQTNHSTANRRKVFSFFYQDKF